MSALWDPHNIVNKILTATYNVMTAKLHNIVKTTYSSKETFC